MTDEAIVTLAGDGVKARKVGETTITFTTEDGKYTASCKINVIEPTKDITISSGTYQIDENNKIYEVLDNTTVEDFKHNIATNGETVEVKDKDGNPLEDTDKVGTGSTITISKEITTTPEEGGEPTTSTVTETYIVRIDGDINGDGIVSVTDFSMLKQYLIDNITLEGLKYEAGDLNKDGKITLTDLSMIKQKILADEEVQE